MRTKQALVLVDGNNVMGSRPDGWWRDRGQAMRRLVGELALHRQQVGGEWTVVFDGPPRQEAAGWTNGLRVDYAVGSRANSADDRIVEIAAQANHRAEAPEVLVYTSDRALRERLLMLGARVEGAGALLKALRKRE